MSSLTTSPNAQTIDVTSSQHEEAVEVTRRFHEVDPKDLKIKIESSSGEAVTIPVSLGRLLQQILQLAASGENLAISQLSQVLTSVEAAKMLGMSRPTLLKLAANGEIQAHKVGAHTRFTRSDIRAFQEKRLAARRAAFDELREFEDSLGLPEN